MVHLDPHHMPTFLLTGLDFSKWATPGNITKLSIDFRNQRIFTTVAVPSVSSSPGPDRAGSYLLAALVSCLPQGTGETFL